MAAWDCTQDGCMRLRVGWLHEIAHRMAAWDCTYDGCMRLHIEWQYVVKFAKENKAVLWVVVCWLLNVSETDLLRQVYVLPHWDRSCRSNFPSHPVAVYWHRAVQSQRWPYHRRAPVRVATGVPIFKSVAWLDREKIPWQAGFEPGIFHSWGGRLTARPTRRLFHGTTKP